MDKIDCEYFELVKKITNELVRYAKIFTLIMYGVITISIGIIIFFIAFSSTIIIAAKMIISILLIAVIISLHSMAGMIDNYFKLKMEYCDYKIKKCDITTMTLI
jgi:cobalamin biosynthesis protein CobD/CbiB